MSDEIKETAVTIGNFALSLDRAWFESDHDGRKPIIEGGDSDVARFAGEAK